MNPQFTEGTDITARLTTWCHAPQAESAQDLMDEAADEIERLRSLVRFQDRVIRSGDVSCLTSEEREAIAYSELTLRCETHPVCERHTATLRSLLERTRPDA
jgi:hypothetical protein